MRGIKKEPVHMLRGVHYLHLGQTNHTQLSCYYVYKFKVEEVQSLDVHFCRRYRLVFKEIQLSSLDFVGAMMWPEALVPVQSLAESGIQKVPSRYVKPQWERPIICTDHTEEEQAPVIDLSGLQHPHQRSKVLHAISNACSEWGFFQVINHDINTQLLKSVKEVSREFFSLPPQEKLKHANDPVTYVGYGSRLGVDKNSGLDWGDYFFHHFLPLSIREEHRWPSHPLTYKEVMKQYCEDGLDVAETLLKAMSENLGLTEDKLKESFGGSVEACVRLNFYPVCPEPDLTLGLSAHSDPGGITLLLQNEVDGLQVRKDGRWVSVLSIPNALIVNIGDQIQIMTNGLYKSAEHRTVVNGNKERMSVVLFCNPQGEKTVEPIHELLAEDDIAKYMTMTFNNYRKFIRTGGIKGKDYVHHCAQKQLAIPN